MSAVAIGARVRITHDASGSVLVGEVRNVADKGLVLDVGGRFFELYRDDWTLTVEEPVLGTVVLDRNGVAWQRLRDAGWSSSWLVSSPRRNYADLSDRFGPLKVVYTPGSAR